MDAVQMTFCESPDHMFGSVASKAKIHRFTVCVVFCPHFLAVAFPALGDRIPDKCEINIAFTDNL